MGFIEPWPRHGLRKSGFVTRAGLAAAVIAISPDHAAQHIGGFAAHLVAAAGSILQTSVDERSNGKARADRLRVRFEANMKLLRITRRAIVLLVAGAILASCTSSRLGTTVGDNPALTGEPPNDTKSR
jgi:hypothetical protein